MPDRCCCRLEGKVINTYEVDLSSRKCRNLRPSEPTVGIVTITFHGLVSAIRSFRLFGLFTYTLSTFINLFLFPNLNCTACMFVKLPTCLAVLQHICAAHGLRTPKRDIIDNNRSHCFLVYIDWFCYSSFTDNYIGWRYSFSIQPLYRTYLYRYFFLEYIINPLSLRRAWKKNRKR